MCENLIHNFNIYWSLILQICVFKIHINYKYIPANENRIYFLYNYNDVDTSKIKWILFPNFVLTKIIIYYKHTCVKYNRTRIINW